MSNRNWQSAYITSPRGQWSIVAQKKTGSPSRASTMANARIAPGVCLTRPGTSAVVAATGAVAGMFNWVTPSNQYLVLFKEGSSIVSLNQSGETITTLLNALNGAVQPCFADLDVWTYFCAYNSSDVGTIQAEIFDGTNVDKAFRGPVVWTADSATDGGVGNASAGTHYFGFVYQNRTGYSGIPTTGLTFAITATTNASPDVITAPGNNLITGDTLTIAGATGDTAINGVFTATVVTPGSTFKITNASGAFVAGNGAYTGNGVLTVPLQFQISGGYSISATANVTFSVSAATNASPTVLTVPGHTFTNGDTVVGAGATGNTAINGTFLVTNVSGGTLELTDLFGNLINGNGVYTGGGSLTAPDLITATGNNLNTGDAVTITGATGDTAINTTTGSAVVVTAGSTFTLLDQYGNPVLSNGAYTGGGIVEGPIPNTRQVNLSVTLPALTDGGTDANGGVQATLFLIATPANNSANWFFIPDNTQTGQVGEQPVPYNTPTTLTFVFNASDFDINASYDSANAQFLLLAQDSSGNGPFNPNFVVAYGLRMVYGTGTVAYASDLDAPQSIAADLNQIVMPNQRNISMAFQLPNSSSLYLTGDGWTAYTTDNGDSPSTWAVPIKVSDKLGSGYPNLVCYTTGGNYAWMAMESGVWYFDGTFSDKPITYLVSDIWQSVNWNVAGLIEIKDDPANLKLYVSIPVYPSNVPNFVIVFDYQNGKGFDQMDISTDNFLTPDNFGSIGVIKEYGSGLTNLWVGPSGAGNIFRYNSGVYNDQGNPIDSFWIGNLFLGTEQMTSQMIRVGAGDIWVRGEGDLDIVWRGPDNVQQVTSALLTVQGYSTPMSTAPGLTYQTKLDFPQIENFTFGVGVGELNSWFSLSGYRPYYKPDLWNR